MQLDARLSLALSLYDPCDLAADIGTDHAHLPIALLRAGICRRMILTDVSPHALQNARENIARRRLTDRVEFRLGDGLTPLGEACGTVSVLGMGGRTIYQILTGGAPRLQGAGLLLSAHTDLPLVRRAVTEIGYHLVSETPCRDAGRFYLMLKAAPGEETLTPRETRMGKRLFEARAEELVPYLRHVEEVLTEKRAGLLRARDAGGGDDARLCELDGDLALLREYTR